MRVGIIGAGQLGQMLALAGYPLGITCTFLDRHGDAPGGLVSRMLLGELDDVRQLDALAAGVDVVTFEFENIPVAALERAGAAAPVYPPATALAAAQDRLHEKRLFECLGIPTASYVAVDTAEDLRSVGQRLGWPVVLKARRLGYDGRGQRVVHSARALEPAWTQLGGVAAIAERWVDFERELSLIGVRGADGDVVFYPLCENLHDDGILSQTLAPFEDPGLQRTAQHWLTAIMERFEYRGVLTVEFFQTASGLVANEMAPRVHNSGHWTIEGAETSQFENHLRAVLGLPLGGTAARGCAAMLNLIGRMPDTAKLLGLRDAHLHDYGKAPRPNRKLGHCTIVGPDQASVAARLSLLKAAVDPSAAS